MTLSQRLRQINPCEAIALYDYLDRDNIPASVAVPTVERVPMIVGVEIDADSDLKVEIAEEEGDNSEQTADGIRTTRKSVTYYPKFSGNIDVNTGYAFPFKYRKELNAKAGDFNWVSGEVPKGEIRCKVRTRYKQKEQWATVRPVAIKKAPEDTSDAPRGLQAEIFFDEPQRAITPGQAAVLYDEDVVLGGGTILQSGSGDGSGL